MGNFHSQAQFIRMNIWFLQITGMEEYEFFFMRSAQESKKSPGRPTAIMYSSDAARRGVLMVSSYDTLMYSTLSE